MKKVICVMNGKGGCGKDTIMDFVLEKIPGMKISSIDPVKEVARVAGWNGSKDNKSRKFLSDLKKLMEEYNDAPLNHMIRQIKDSFLHDDNQRILFTCIREKYNIDKFKKAVSELILTEGVKVTDIEIQTILVERRETEGPIGNSSDDNVNDYLYDYLFQNNGTLDDARIQSVDFFNQLVCGFTPSEIKPTFVNRCGFLIYSKKK